MGCRAPSCLAVKWACLTRATEMLSLRDLVLSAAESKAAEDFCQRHDARLCLQIDPEQPQDSLDTATMPLALGGLGCEQNSLLGHAGRLLVRDPQAPHHRVCSFRARQPEAPFLKAASRCQRELTGRMDLMPPSWRDLALGA